MKWTLDISSDEKALRTIKGIVEGLEEETPTQVELIRHDFPVGSMELSRETYRKEAGCDYQVEIRNIHINEMVREQGNLRQTIECLKLGKLPIIGEIAEEELRCVWEKIGAEFINDYDFVIR